MKQIKVLAIGNSFSQDATRYLYQIARADKVDMKVVHLHIGSCPLSVLYKNFICNDDIYAFELNGVAGGLNVNVKEVLTSEAFRGNWDYITIQQVSNQSWDYETYQPYLNKIIDYIKEYSPKSKILIHQTWAYRADNARIQEFGFSDRNEMFLNVKQSYEKAYHEINADGIIPSGETVQKLVSNNIDNVYRDGLHVSYGLGRYALALTWYEYITGNKTDNNTFCDLDEDVTEEQMKTAKRLAHEAVCEYISYKK